MTMERDRSTDLLRTFGLLLVMLAHTAPPPLLFELRNFDIVLLVAVSGIAFSISRTPKRFWPYASARFKRLILPVWLFLTVLFAAIWLTGFGDNLLTSE